MKKIYIILMIFLMGCVASGVESKRYVSDGYIIYGTPCLFRATTEIYLSNDCVIINTVKFKAKGSKTLSGNTSYQFGEYVLRHNEHSRDLLILKNTTPQIVYLNLQSYD